jgi:hypothetical protein
VSATPGLPCRSYRELVVVSPELERKMSDLGFRLGAEQAGYPVLADWHPAIPAGWGEFPPVPFERSVVYRGSAGRWAYSHHQSIVRFRDRIVVAWSNGFRHEDYVGQEVHLAWSRDGRTWSEPAVVAETTADSGIVRNNAGLYATADRLYCYVGVARDFGRDVASPGMNVVARQHIRLDVHETADLETWSCHEGICDDVYLFEGPRPTRGGPLLCCGFSLTDRHAMVLRWDDPARPAAPPRVVHLPASREGVQPEQGTWFQADGGRILMFQRDGGLSGRLGLTTSDDGGETWSELLRTNFPNTYSRAFAGRLPDGRFYLAGNNYDRFLDRRSLLVALSDDGATFDRQYLLVSGDTTRAVEGRHKEDGYHYPHCVEADGGKLLVVYSVNKEDIEVGIADMAAVR